MKWLRKAWDWMTWEPTWPPGVTKGPVRVYQPLLDCLGVVQDDPVRF